MNLRLLCTLSMAVAVAALGFSGCATSTGGASAYTRDGAAYGVTKGTFRGRWWNYYERGRSFQDGSFFAESEVDLRTALRGRSRDQLWARTYGMHFTPEYFPHRELGVTLYYRQRFEEAASELELSIGQQPSARAAYFLDLSRAALVQARGANTAPPALEILSPAPGTVVSTRAAEIRAAASSENFISVVRVAGEKCAIPSSAVRQDVVHRVTLAPGANEIPVEAEDLAGRSTTATVRIVLDIDGPTVSFDSAPREGAAISGVVHDLSGVAALRVGGRSAALDDRGSGQFAFAVPPADLSQAGEALRYECEDRLGNVTRDAVPHQFIRLTSGGMPHPRIKAAEGTLGSPPLSPVWAMQSAVLGATEGPAPRPSLVEFSNVRDGQEYLMDEIVVSLTADANAEIASAELNGRPFDVVPGRTLLHLNRRVALVPGANELLATIHLASGETLTQRVTVVRRENAVEQERYRLSLAPAGLVPEGNAPKLPGELDYAYSRINNGLAAAKRFNLVDRSLLPEVLAEQQLSAALSSDKGRLALNRLVPAETVLVGRTHRDPASIEIVVEAFSTDTAITVARADVAGKADTVEQLDALASDLALQIVQQFPRAKGAVAQVRGNLARDANAQARPVLAIVPELLPAGADASESERAAVVTEIERTLQQADRFAFAARRNLDALALETRLAELAGSSSARTAVGRAIPAQAYVYGELLAAGAQRQVAVTLVRCETGEILATGRADAADASEDAVRRAARDAGAQIVSAAEQLPRPQQLAEGSGRFVSSIGSVDLVRESTKFVVYRNGADVVDPVSHEVLGQTTEVIAEGLVRAVGKDASVAEVVAPRDGDAQPVRVGDYVATK